MLKLNLKEEMILTMLLALYLSWEYGVRGFVLAIVISIAASVLNHRVADYRRLKALEKDLDEDNLTEETLYYPNGEVNVLYGDEKDMREHFKKYVQQGPRRIMRAAVLATDGRIWTVSPPGRHHHCFEAMDVFGDQFGSKYHQEEGFVDSEGTFHDRQDSCRIARDAGQLFLNGLPKTNPPYELFSEDLWGVLNTDSVKPKYQGNER